jgi:hypothetical protein
VDAALRQVLQTVAQVLDLKAEAKARLFTLADRAPAEKPPAIVLRENAVVVAEPRRHVRRLHRVAEPVLLEFRGPALTNIKAFEGWQARTDPVNEQEALRAVFSLRTPERLDLADGKERRTTREFHCDEDFVGAVLEAEGTQDAFPEAYGEFQRAWAERPGHNHDRDR